jgi:hypothetical protein
MKDPIALFSAEWLADAFNMDAVVMIRHPGAFVNSLVRLGWRHPFDHFTKQPELMDELAPWTEDIVSFSQDERPLVDQAILLWNIIHDRIRQYRERHPEWLFLRLEDIAADPLDRFAALYRDLGLTWTDRSHAVIEEYSSMAHPAESEDASSHRRDSRAAVNVWKSRLSPDEVARIRSGTERVVKEFYGDDDW